MVSAGRNAGNKEPLFLAFDLFCGAGGTTRGFIDAGGYVFAGVDNDSACRKTYRANNRNRYWPYDPPAFLEYDLRQNPDGSAEGQRRAMERIEALLNSLRLHYPTIPLFIAITPPCQPFTRLGTISRTDARALQHELDSTLLLQSLNFVRKFLPDVVFSENVPGIDSQVYGGVWSEFISRLENLGYVVGDRVVCASRFGVPQYRRRAIIIAIRRPVILPELRSAIKLELPDEDPNAKPITVAQAIGHLPALAAGEAHPDIPNHRTPRLSQVNIQRLKAARPGEQNTILAETDFGDLSLGCHVRLRQRKNGRPGFTDVYMRMDPNKPSPTITTKCHSISNGRFGHYDVNQVRGISLREAAILQSFPEDYVFYPETAIAPVARMIGNAVPPKLAQFFAGWAYGRLNLEYVKELRAV